MKTQIAGKPDSLPIKQQFTTKTKKETDYTNYCRFEIFLFHIFDFKSL